MISVIVPYKEDRGYLDHALESLDAQTSQDYELILSQSDNSAGYNFNRGVEKAKGEFVVYLCDDDLLINNSLEIRQKFMRKSKVDFMHAKGYKLLQDTRLVEYGLTNPYAQFNEVLKNNGILGGSTMYRTEVLKQNLMDESLTTAEEWELHLRLLSKGYKLGFLNEFVYIYRIHSQQKSIGNMSPAYQEKRNEVKEMIRSWYTQAQ